MVEPVLSPHQQRIESVEADWFNTFLLPSKDVYIDLLTNRDTSFVSGSKRSVIMLDNDPYAITHDFIALEEVDNSRDAIKGLNMVYEPHDLRCFP